MNVTLTSASVFQMFQRLCIHVIQRLRPVHAHLYLQPGMEDGYFTPDYWQLWKFNVSLSRLFFTSWKYQTHQQLVIKIRI